MSHPFTVFYSWQSHEPNVNRNFIEDALKRAVKSLKGADLEIAIDRDTQGLPGSPNISEAIFDKIARCDAFVCDASIVNPGAVFPTQERVRPSPNANVLIELGYAVRVLGWDRIVLIVNEEFGGVESLPFDINRQRAIRYSLQVGQEKPEVRKSFVATLERAIEALHAQGVRTETRPRVPSPAEVALEAIREGRADVPAKIRALWPHWIASLDALNPRINSPEDSDPSVLEARLRQGLEQAVPLTVEFAEVAALVADGSSERAVQELFDGFLPLLKRYEPAYREGEAPVSHYLVCGGDFFRFLGHEWFVQLVAALLRAEKFTWLGNLLSRPLTYARVGQLRAEPSGFEVLNPAYFEQNILLLHSGTRHPSQTHGGLLWERHQTAPLKNSVGWEEFRGADYFLFLAATLNDDQWEGRITGINRWPMWTVSHGVGLPAWAISWQRRAVVTSWLPALGMESVEELQSRLRQRSAVTDPGKFLGRPGVLIHPELIGMS